MLAETDHETVNERTGGKDVRAVVTQQQPRGPHVKLSIDVITDDWAVYTFGLNPGSGLPTRERRVMPDGRRAVDRRQLPEAVREYLRDEFGGFV